MSSKQILSYPKPFLDEFYSELKKKKHSKPQITALKMRLVGKHGVGHIPTDHELLLAAPEEVRPQLLSKPVRTQSGVAVVALMTEPRACDHGVCTMCPGGPDSVFGSVPQSYTGNEPASMRAARNNYSAYLQVFNRLEQYLILGHEPGKVEMIVMGGTFLSYPQEYQCDFISDALAAMNDFSTLFYPSGKLDREKFRIFFDLPHDLKDKNLRKELQRKILSLRPPTTGTSASRVEREQHHNEQARIRCIALCLETKPDWSKEKHINQMLLLGTTRIELGAQCLDDKILERVNRGHTVADTEEAAALLKDSFLKIGYHMMPGLPGSSEEKDIGMFREIFSNPAHRPDSLKIYPCLVMPGTPLAREYERGEFEPLTTEQAARICAEAKRYIPEYCRVMRIQRDIPSTKILAGPKYTNLRQKVHEILKKEKRKCRCLRCREPGTKEVDTTSIRLKRQFYTSSGGEEAFISLEDSRHDLVLGYCRVRLPSQPFRPEITERTAGVRELHVFGTATELGHKGGVQHRGFGNTLLTEAERIAQEEFDARHILVISGIGVREYFRKKGYRREGPYLGKMLK